MAASSSLPLDGNPAAALTVIVASAGAQSAARLVRRAQDPVLPRFVVQPGRRPAQVDRPPVHPRAQIRDRLRPLEYDNVHVRAESLPGHRRPAGGGPVVQLGAIGAPLRGGIPEHRRVPAAVQTPVEHAGPAVADQRHRRARAFQGEHHHPVVPAAHLVEGEKSPVRGEGRVAAHGPRRGNPAPRERDHIV